MQKEIRALKITSTTHSGKSLHELSESIKAVGILEPIVINAKGQVLSGARRVLAAKLAGLKSVPVSAPRLTPLQEEIARLDANLMVIPVGRVEYDQMLSRRKKLFEDEYPETRKHHAGGSGSHGYVARTAKRLGVSKRTIGQAVARYEKASPNVMEARKTKGLSPSKVNELVKLTPQAQDKFLPFVLDRPVGQVREAVKLVHDNGVRAAMQFLEREPLPGTLAQIDNYTEKLTLLLHGAMNEGVDVYPHLVSKLHKLTAAIEKFIGARAHAPRVTPHAQALRAN